MTRNVSIYERSVETVAVQEITDKVLVLLATCLISPHPDLGGGWVQIEFPAGTRHIVVARSFEGESDVWLLPDGAMITYRTEGFKFGTDRCMKDNISHGSNRLKPVECPREVRGWLGLESPIVRFRRGRNNAPITEWEGKIAFPERGGIIPRIAFEPGPEVDGNASDYPGDYAGDDHIYAVSAARMNAAKSVYFLSLREVFDERAERDVACIKVTRRADGSIVDLESTFYEVQDVLRTALAADVAARVEVIISEHATTVTVLNEWLTHESLRKDDVEEIVRILRDKGFAPRKIVQR